MIPRRRIDIDWADAADWWRGLTDSAAAAAAERRAFEAAASQTLAGRRVQATASGRDALDLILEALGLVPGDELVVPAYTLGELVVRLLGRGFKPVAADVDVASFTVTAESVARAISPRTRAIVVLHTFGAPCDSAGIAALAQAHGLPLIEDCAHAFGASSGDRPAGSLGTAALFSLEVNKPVAAFGGGLVATGDADLAEHVAARLAARRESPWPAAKKAALKMAEEFAVRSPAYGLAARLMFRDGGGIEALYRNLHDRVRPADVALSGFQARMGRRRLARLAERNEGLNRLWAALAERLPAALVPQQRDRHGSPAAYNFVARYDGDPRPLRRRAQALGLDLAIGSEVLDDAAALLGQSDCPGAAQVFAQAVAIPCHHGIGEARLERIAAILGRIA